MNENPYRAPESNVSDVEPSGLPARPPVVTRAVYLLWFSFALSMPVAVYGMLQPDPELPQAVMVALTLFGLGINFVISLWLYTASWKGRGYARWVLAALLLVGFLFLAWLYGSGAEDDGLPWFADVLDISANLLDAIGTALLFTPGANAWYRAMQERR